MVYFSFLRRCLTLAEKGRGKTGINPMVGAVLVRPAERRRMDNGQWTVGSNSIVAEGYHAEFGHPHAERMLLKEFKGEIFPTDILYVNLEPCCHKNKKTPPCTDIIVERGITTVVYGMKDPNPAVSGKGIEYLNKKGVQVIGPVLEQECRRMNRGFVSLMTKGRPWITLKKAQTVDGRIAKSDGSPLTITSEEQNAWSHAFLRARHDAILVGVGTVLADDPNLTVRYGDARPPIWRIVLDASLRIPLTARVLGPRTIVVTTPGAKSEKKEALQAKGVRMIEVPFSSGAFDWSLLFTALMTPDHDFYGISSILVEGGQKTWDCFKKAGMMDEEVTLVG